MKTTTKENKERRTYRVPLIELIRLDNEISLQLASDTNPAEEPNWSKASTHPTDDPYKMA
ncbi:MAG: hypothetical protein H6Q19_1432 [Bacteroidetes bacterium]|nr:hypothetical protein [Bacteroidota bacterium]